MEVELPLSLLPSQWQFFRWEPPPELARAGPTVEAILGGYGASKTTAGLVKFVKLACANPRTPAYGRTARPKLACVGPTSRHVDAVLQPKLEALIPPALIRRRWGRPHPRWHLINGAEIVFVSNEASFEGEDLAVILIDEIQYLATAPEKYVNYLARLRDRHSPRRALIACGLPEAGWVRATFDLDALAPQERAMRHTLLVGTRDNPHLSEGLVAQIMAACPSGYEEALIGGGWMPGQNALYPMLGDENIVPDSKTDTNAALWLGMDIGVSSAVCLGQDYATPHGRGVLIVQDIVLSHASVSDMCAAVKATPWAHLIIAGKSSIAVDPTIRADEQQAIYKAFPGVRVIIRSRTDPLYHVQAGLRLVQAALQNAKGERRLFVSERCRRTKNGVLEAWQNARTSPVTGRRVKDDRLDHSEDSARYLVNAMLGDRGFSPQVH